MNFANDPHVWGRSKGHHRRLELASSLQSAALTPDAASVCERLARAKCRKSVCIACFVQRLGGSRCLRRELRLRDFRMEGAASVTERFSTSANHFGSSTLLTARERPNSQVRTSEHKIHKDTRGGTIRRLVQLSSWVSKSRSGPNLEPSAALQNSNESRLD